MTSEKNIELMKKMMALAERGIDGEKETAKRKLEQLMDKYDALIYKRGRGKRSVLIFRETKAEAIQEGQAASKDD